MAASREWTNWRGALWLRRQRVRGRRRFIWAFIIPRFALPVTILATALRAVTEPFHWGHFLLHAATNVLVAGIGGGYVTGVLLWIMVVARGTEPPGTISGRRQSRPDGDQDRRAAGR